MGGRRARDGVERAARAVIGGDETRSTIGRWKADSQKVSRKKGRNGAGGGGKWGRASVRLD